MDMHLVYTTTQNVQLVSKTFVIETTSDKNFALIVAVQFGPRHGVNIAKFFSMDCFHQPARVTIRMDSCINLNLRVTVYLQYNIIYI